MRGCILALIQLMAWIACHQARAEQLANCPAAAISEIRVHLPSTLGGDVAALAALSPSELSARGGPSTQMMIAASELRAHLSGYAAITFNSGEVAPCSHAIVLDNSSDRESGEFQIASREGNLFVTASSQIDVLYGTYEALKLFGFRWYSPDPLWMVRPDKLAWPELKQPISTRALFKYRGAHTYKATISDDHLLWMARNRFNLIGYEGANIVLAKTLAINLTGGGHDLVQKILDPERMVDGVRLIDRHPDWFGSAHRGSAKSADVYTNPCYGQPLLSRYFADELAKDVVDGDLKSVDIINIWPSDQLLLNLPKDCVKAESENGTDQLFRFYAGVVSRLDEVLKVRSPDRTITISGISYYDTWRLPRHEVVASVKPGTNVKYLHVLYLNERTFSAPVASEQSPTNQRIMAAFKSWSESLARAGLQIGVCEYYNYSIFLSLPAPHMRLIGADFKTYNDAKVALVSFMHPLRGDAGPARLVEIVRSSAVWSSHAGSPAALQDYAQLAFGEHGPAMLDIYSALDLALENLAEVFGPVTSARFVTGQDKIWSKPPLSHAFAVEAAVAILDGGRRTLPAFRAAHFSPLESSFTGVEKSRKLLSGAADRLDGLLKQTTGVVAKRLAAEAEWLTYARAMYDLISASMNGFTGRETSEQTGAEFQRALDRINAANKMDASLSALSQERLFRDSVNMLRPR